MAEEQEKSYIKRNWKRIGKMALGGLTGIVSFPVAGTIIAGKGRRLEGAITGAILSGVCSLGTASAHPYQTIYKSPDDTTRIVDITSASPELLISTMLNSPLTHSAVIKNRETRLTIGADEYGISGNDIIQTSNGRYELFFPEDRSFSYHGDTVEGLADARKRVGKYRIMLNEVTSGEGLDIIEAERLREKLEKEKETLRAVSQKYEEVKSAFENTVSDMNERLEELAGE